MEDSGRILLPGFASNHIRIHVVNKFWLSVVIAKEYIFKINSLVDPSFSFCTVEVDTGETLEFASFKLLLVDNVAKNCGSFKASQLWTTILFTNFWHQN